jgi:hypothetical protein
LREHKFKQETSTSFRFAERERFNEVKWKQRAAGGMRTFLIFGQPTQLRFWSRRFGWSIVGSWKFSRENMAGNSES